MSRRGNSSPASPLRVLVVEDDSATTHALELLLRHQGHEVLMASNVDEALRHVASEPDVILLDLMLPDGDGMHVLEAVRERGLKSRVVVITGVGDADHLDRVHLLKPDALLKKPVDFFQILAKLVPVVKVHDFKGESYIERDLALITVTVTPETRSEVIETTNLFRGRVVDVSRESIIVELAGTEEKIEAFIDLMRDHGIKELARTRVIAMARGA